MEPVVFLPGFMSDGRIFRDLIEPMSRSRTVQVASLSGVDTVREMAAKVLESLPGRCMLVGHSLGARVALCALGDGAPIDKMILLAAAEFSLPAQSALDSAAGRDVQVLNVPSRENDLFDFAMERLVRAPEPGARMIGHGLPPMPNVATLQLDHDEALTRLRRTGFPIARPERRICHWSPYLRPGVFPLYRAMLSGALPFAQLRAILPSEIAPRWSRLLPRAPRLPLPALLAR
mgnify:CR=1 FL=1